MTNPTAGQRFASDKYGGDIYIRQSRVIANTVGVELVRPNAERVGLIFINREGGIISISFGRDFANTLIVPLVPVTGFLSVSVDEDGALPTLGVYLVSSPGATTLGVTEVIRYNETDVVL